MGRITRILFSTILQRKKLIIKVNVFMGGFEQTILTQSL